MKNDTHGFSPDMGRWVCRDGKYYTEYGMIYQSKQLTFTRIGFSSEGEPKENYADWTDEKRNEVFAEQAELVKREVAERQDKIDARVVLIHQAAKKLSKEEFDAILDEGHMQGRGYDHSGEDFSKLFEEPT